METIKCNRNLSIALKLLYKPETFCWFTPHQPYFETLVWDVCHVLIFWREKWFWYMSFVFFRRNRHMFKKQHVRFSLLLKICWYTEIGGPFLDRPSLGKNKWISFAIHYIIRAVASHRCHNVNGGFTKPPLKLEYRRVTAYHLTSPHLT